LDGVELLLGDFLDGEADVFLFGELHVMKAGAADVGFVGLVAVVLGFHEEGAWGGFADFAVHGVKDSAPAPLMEVLK
jgi:hypothetical protein